MENDDAVSVGYLRNEMSIKLRTKTSDLWASNKTRYNSSSSTLLSCVGGYELLH